MFRSGQALFPKYENKVKFQEHRETSTPIKVLKKVKQN